MSGRIRSIKPELLEDAASAGLSDAAFRLFVSMLLMADDYGNLRAEPALLKSKVWWAKDPSLPVPKAIAELGRLVVFYEVDGQRYASVRNWAKHQRVDKPGKPRIPGPPESVASPREEFLESRESVANIPESLATDQEEEHRNIGSRTTDQDQPCPDKPDLDPVGLVFEHFLACRKAHSAKSRNVALDDKDRKELQRILKGGRSVEDMKLAVQGMFLSPHHVGMNDRNTEYLALKYALKESNIDSFIALAERGEKPARPSGNYRIGQIVQRAPESGPIWNVGEVVG